MTNLAFQIVLKLYNNLNSICDKWTFSPNLFTVWNKFVIINLNLIKKNSIWIKFVEQIHFQLYITYLKWLWMQFEINSLTQIHFKFVNVSLKWVDTIKLIQVRLSVFECDLFWFEINSLIQIGFKFDKVRLKWIDKVNLIKVRLSVFMIISRIRSSVGY